MNIIKSRIHATTGGREKDGKCDKKFEEKCFAIFEERKSKMDPPSPVKRILVGV